MGRLPSEVTMTTSSTPQPIASSTLYWMRGLFRRGSIPLGWDLVAGRNLVPHPAAVITAFFMLVVTGAGYLRVVFRPVCFWVGVEGAVGAEVGFEAAVGAGAVLGFGATVGAEV